MRFLITGWSIIFSSNNPPQPQPASISSKCATAWSFHGQLRMGRIDEQDSAHARCRFSTTCNSVLCRQPRDHPTHRNEIRIGAVSGVQFGAEPVQFGPRLPGGGVIQVEDLCKPSPTYNNQPLWSTSKFGFGHQCEPDIDNV